MTKTVAIIQARMSSTRLPGKVLTDLGGLPAIAWTIRAARAIAGVDDVVLATSVGDDDDALVEWCEQNGLACHRGPLDDVLERYRLAAHAEGADVIVRLTGDCPFLDPAVCGEVVMLQKRSGADYAANIEPRSWPDGLDCEVFTVHALNEAAAKASTRFDREHVTPYIRRNRDKFPAVNLLCPVNLKDEMWTLDNPEDMTFLNEIVARIDASRPPSYLQVLEVLDNEPDLRAINQEAPRTASYNGQGMAAHGHERSNAYIERAEHVIPLGSQTFSKSRLQYPQGISPLFINRGLGGHVWDVDGNEYVDLVSGLLPVVLGYCDPDVDQAVRQQLDHGITFSMPTCLEMELAERLVDVVPCAEKVRFGKNGTDATSAAIRLARAYTGRDRVAVCGYHGWQDWYIGSTTRDKGVPAAVKSLTHMFPYNDLQALDSLLQQHDGEFAAVVMEPMNVTVPQDGYLSGVKALAHKHGCLLIFDEVITGFRFALGGAQEYFGVTPDLACFGKALGNGMPISAVAGRADVMGEMMEVFISGTFGGESLSLAAAIAVIDKMRREPVIPSLWQTGAALRARVSQMIESFGLQDVVSLGGTDVWSFTLFSDHQSAPSAVIKTYWMCEMIKEGVLTLGTHNICYAHTDGDVAWVAEVYERAFAGLAERLRAGDLAERLEVPVIEPVFKVR